MDRDYLGSGWADHHDRVSDWLANGINKLAYVFDRLARLQYDAPWDRERSHRPTTFR